MSKELEQFKALLKSAGRRKPKSTENLFFTYADIRRAYGVVESTVYKWAKYFPHGLPITRMQVDKVREMRKLARKRAMANNLLCLEVKGALRWTYPRIKKELGWNVDQIRNYWKNGLKYYDQLVKESNLLPVDKEKFLADYNKLKHKRRMRRMKQAYTKAKQYWRDKKNESSE